MVSFRVCWRLAALAWVRVSNGSNRACGRNLAGCWRFCGLCPCVAVGLPLVLAGEAAHKRAFGVFIRRAVAIFVRLSRFICRAFGVFLCVAVCLARWLARSFGRLLGYNYHYSHLSNYTGAIIPLVTITKVTIPCVIDRHYYLCLAINKSNNKCNVNLS